MDFFLNINLKLDKLDKNLIAQKHIKKLEKLENSNKNSLSSKTREWIELDSDTTRAKLEHAFQAWLFLRSTRQKKLELDCEKLELDSARITALFPITY